MSCFLNDFRGIRVIDTTNQEWRLGYSLFLRVINKNSETVSI